MHITDSSMSDMCIEDTLLTADVLASMVFLSFLFLHCFEWLSPCYGVAVEPTPEGIQHGIIRDSRCAMGKR